eukprot:759076-Hanusia_phi.AAC.3
MIVLLRGRATSDMCWVGTGPALRGSGPHSVCRFFDSMICIHKLAPGGRCPASLAGVGLGMIRADRRRVRSRFAGAFKSLSVTECMAAAGACHVQQCPGHAS